MLMDFVIEFMKYTQMMAISLYFFTGICSALIAKRIKYSIQIIMGIGTGGHIGARAPCFTAGSGL